MKSKGEGWEYPVTDESEGKEILLTGRRVSNLDIPVMLRGAGLNPNEKRPVMVEVVKEIEDPDNPGKKLKKIELDEQLWGAQAILFNHFNDVVIEVGMARCIESVSVGFGPGCKYKPTDFSDQEREDIMALIMKPFTINAVKSLIAQNRFDLIDPDELQDVLEAGELTPEEVGQAEAFRLKSDTGQGDNGPGQVESPASPPSPGNVSKES